MDEPQRLRFDIPVHPDPSNSSSMLIPTGKKFAGSLFLTPYLVYTNIFEGAVGVGIQTSVLSDIPGMAGDKTRGRFSQMLEKFKWERRLRSASPEPEKLLVERHVCHGWDHTNQRWHAPVWPDLDLHLRPVQNAPQLTLDWSPESQQKLSKEPGTSGGA